MFEMGFYFGSIVFISAMIFIPWKCFGRQNIKVAKFSTSTRENIVKKITSHNNESRAVSLLKRIDSHIATIGCLPEGHILFQDISDYLSETADVSRAVAGNSSL